MPNDVTNLGGVQNTLLGIACSEIIDSVVKPEWQKRFQGENAVWLAVPQENQADELDRELREWIRSQGIRPNGKQILPVLFFDLTADSEDLRAKHQLVFKAIERCQKEFSWRIPLVLEFAWLGEKLSSKRGLLRENAKTLKQNNESHHLLRIRCFLTASLPIYEEKDPRNWSAVMALLTMLCRVGDPVNCLPWDSRQIDGGTTEGNISNDNIGFLAYGEYREKDWKELDRQLKENQHSLSDEGEEALRENLREKQKELAKRLEEEFSVDAKMQPLHSDLFIPEDRCFRRRRKDAKKGKDKAYEQARVNTRNALKKTADHLREDILQEANQGEQEATESLNQLLQNSKPGLYLEKNEERMKALLCSRSSEESNIPLPELDYKEEVANYQDEIQDYLNKVRNAALEEAKHNWTDGLWKAYQSRVQHTDYKKKEEELKEQAHSLEKKKNILMKKDCLLELLRDGHTRLSDSAFNPSKSGGDKRTMVLFNDPSDRKTAELSAQDNTIQKFCLDETRGVGEVFESAFVYAVQVFSFLCDEARLPDLIPD